MSRTEDLLNRYNLERAGSLYKVFDVKPETLVKQTIALIIFLGIFGVAVPYFILKSGNITLLEAYMPNLDLVANVVGYSTGPAGTGLFSELYNQNKSNLSSLIINYTALLGVTYIIAKYTLESGSVAEGWSRAVIMLLATYLVPGSALAYSLYVIGRSISGFAPVGGFLNWFLTAIAGACIIGALLLFEIALISVTGRQVATLVRMMEKNL